MIKTARLKDILLHNRKLYLTYGMVLCLVTLTDLQTRRAGLSASAVLLVYLSLYVSAWWFYGKLVFEKKLVIR